VNKKIKKLASLFLAILMMLGVFSAIPTGAIDAPSDTTGYIAYIGALIYNDALIQGAGSGAINSVSDMLYWRYKSAGGTLDNWFPKIKYIRNENGKLRVYELTKGLAIIGEIDSADWQDLSELERLFNTHIANVTEKYTTGIGLAPIG